MKVKVTAARWSIDESGAWVSFRTEAPADARAMCDTLEADREYTVELKRHFNKRSLDANAYCFVIISKIAEKIGISTEEIYRKAVREIGGNSTIVCVKNEAVESLCSGWQLNGLGWQTDTIPSKLPGCTNVILYYGSSTYDTKTMGRLIDYVVQDAKALGIETMTPRELSALIERW